MKAISAIDILLKASSERLGLLNDGEVSEAYYGESDSIAAALKSGDAIVTLLEDMELDSDAEERRPIMLSYRETRTLLRGLKTLLGKAERQKAKSNFVPEPGKQDVALSSIETMRELRTSMEALLEIFPGTGARKTMEKRKGA